MLLHGVTLYPLCVVLDGFLSTIFVSGLSRSTQASQALRRHCPVGSSWTFLRWRWWPQDSFVMLCICWKIATVHGDIDSCWVGYGGLIIQLTTKWPHIAAILEWLGRLYIYLSSTCLSVCLSTCLSIYLSIYLSTYLSIYPLLSSPLLSYPILSYPNLSYPILS